MTGMILKTRLEGACLYITLNRPDVRNAFNETLIAELTRVFRESKTDPHIRLVVLDGEGASFCAGADLVWMKSLAAASEEENRKDAQQLADLFLEMNGFPKPLIAKVHGAVFGGGIGLVSVADLVIAEEQTVFSLSEVKLGLIPAVISPFVIAKMGESQARHYFLTGKRFSATEAFQCGLVHAVCSQADLEKHVDQVIQELLGAGPHAVMESKKLIAYMTRHGSDSAACIKYAVDTIARLRVGAEGQEGMQAFLEKRKPDWRI